MKSLPSQVPFLDLLISEFVCHSLSVSTFSLDGMMKWFYFFRRYDRPCGWCMPLGVGSDLVTEQCVWCACCAPGLSEERTSAALNIKPVRNKTLRSEEVKGPAANHYLLSSSLSLSSSHSSPRSLYPTQTPVHSAQLPACSALDKRLTTSRHCSKHLTSGQH